MLVLVQAKAFHVLIYLIKTTELDRQKVNRHTVK